MKTGDRAALFAFVERLAAVPREALDAFAALVAPRTFARSAWLLRGGERATHGFLIVEGLVRELYVGDDGREHTRSLLAEGSMTGSLLDLLSGTVSITWIQAVEATRTLAFPYVAFDALCDRFPEMHVVARRAAEALYVRKTQREHEMLALDASARFARWREEHATLDGRVSRRLVASYLGVTPEHLSRLRQLGPRLQPGWKRRPNWLEAPSN